ncbi:MAG TPA: hypothetical protein VFS94_01715 [Gemmatimonadales bacterium]|nr:hypothetical protein [Gemmatimonadales bacterium]
MSILLPAMLAAISAATALDSVPLTVHVDSSSHLVVVEYVVPSTAATMAGHQHGARVDAGADTHAHDGSHHGSGGHGGHTRHVARFHWPVDGWVRGARVEVADPEGAPLSQRLLHHVNVINFDRRQLLHPALERIYAAGQETRPVSLPATVGVPVTAGMEFALLTAFDPATMHAGSRIRVIISWSPTNQVPRPVDAYPLLLDAGFRPGQTPAYDLPPGRSERSYEFVMPVSGRVLVAGGHLHDYGVEIRLEDIEKQHAVFSLEAVTDSAGRMQHIPLSAPGVVGRGRLLEAGRRYRLTAVYDNPTGAVIPEGAMGEMALLFAPDNPDLALQVDRSQPEIIADVESLVDLQAGTH